MGQTLGGITSRTVNKAVANAMDTHVHHPHPVGNDPTFNYQLLNFFD